MVHEGDLGGWLEQDPDAIAAELAASPDGKVYGQVHPGEEGHPGLSQRDNCWVEAAAKTDAKQYLAEAAAKKQAMYAERARNMFGSVVKHEGHVQSPGIGPNF